MGYDVPLQPMKLTSEEKKNGRVHIENDENGNVKSAYMVNKYAKLESLTYNFTDEQFNRVEEFLNLTKDFTPEQLKELENYANYLKNKDK